MTEKRKDGGPAFPLVVEETGAEWWESGMTLRDYFAAQALGAMGLERYPEARDTKGAAESAYAFADAMLAAREESRG